MMTHLFSFFFFFLLFFFFSYPRLRNEIRAWIDDTEGEEGRGRGGEDIGSKGRDRERK